MRMRMMMVQMMKLTLSKFCSQSYSRKPPPPCLILPPVPLILDTKCGEDEEEDKEEGFLSLPVSSTHHNASTPHHHATLATRVCVDTALCLRSLTTNSNPYCQNSTTHKQGQRIIRADDQFHFQMWPRSRLAVDFSL